MNKEKIGKIKYHGCSCPFSFVQVTIISVYFINIIIFSIFWIPAFATSTALLVVGIVLFYLFNISQGIFYIVASASNTTDPLIYEKNKHKRNNEEKKNEVSIIMENPKLKFCKKCNFTVSIDSYHCKECNKCTLNYDHHWFIIDNCVSNKHFNIFMCLIIMGIVSSAFQIALVIIFYVYLNHFVKANLINAYKNDITSLSLFFVTFILLTNFTIFIYFIFKFIYHIVLKCYGLSSYQYDIQKNEQKKAKKIVHII